MPPKVKQPNTSKKTEQKKKEKVIEDKTFGLKNKKGAKQQRYIQQVEKQVKSGGIPPRKQNEDPTKKKEEKLKDAKELNMIFKPVQKVEKGADPKSILCAFYKFGQCTKGAKCKFSHDIAVERKAEKRSLYVDMRDDDEETMENWTEDKLKEVVEKKHGESEKKKPTTEIICKYFLDAVEKSKYGWFWQCPNGPDCFYRHALPPGFVLQKDRKKEEKKDVISLEELIETERSALTNDKFTKLTLETFLQWKKRKIKEKQETKKKEQDKKRIDFKAGHHIGLSGREMFSFNPELAANDIYDEGDEAFENYSRSEDDDPNEYRILDLDAIIDYGDDTVENTTVPETVNKNGEVAVGALNEDLFLEDLNEDNLSKDLENCNISPSTS